MESTAVYFFIGFILLLAGLSLASLLSGRSKKPPGGLGNALSGLHEMLEPSRRHLTEVREEKKRDHKQSGDPPDPMEEP